MAILSISKFEAVLARASIKVDRVMIEDGKTPALEQAKRDIDKILALARDSEKLKNVRELLDSTCDVLRSEIPNDDDLRNDLWDCLDYIDYRV